MVEVLAVLLVVVLLILDVVVVMVELVVVVLVDAAAVVGSVGGSGSDVGNCGGGGEGVMTCKLKFLEQLRVNSSSWFSHSNIKLDSIMDSQLTPPGGSFTQNVSSRIPKPYSRKQIIKANELT